MNIEEILAEVIKKTLFIGLALGAFLASIGFLTAYAIFRMVE